MMIQTALSRVYVTDPEACSPFSPTVPYPPLNISHKIIHLSQRAAPGEADSVNGGQRSSRQARDVPLMKEQPEEESVSEEVSSASHVPVNAKHNLTRIAAVYANSSQTEEAEPQSYWLDPTEPSPVDSTDEEFVNAVVSEYEDSNEPGSAMGLPAEASVLPTSLPPVLLELRWLPPKPPTSYDGFNVFVYRDGKRAAPLITAPSHQG